MPSDLPAGPENIVPIATLKHSYMLHALRVLGGNVAAAAKALEVSEMTLYRAMEHEKASMDDSKSKGK